MSQFYKYNDNLPGGKLLKRFLKARIQSARDGLALRGILAQMDNARLTDQFGFQKNADTQANDTAASAAKDELLADIDASITADDQQMFDEFGADLP